MIAAPASTTALPPAPLYVREDGTTGPCVVCLHSSIGSHGQWRSLATRLSATHRVRSFDLHGHGRSPGWPTAHGRSLLVDAQAVMERLKGEPQVDLVAHSYGAGVALQIALRHPAWVRSLSLYEPVAFGLLARLSPADPALAEITQVASSVRTLVDLGELAEAAGRFVDYWGGEGSFRTLDAAQQAVVMDRIPTIPHHFAALFAATWGRETLGRLAMPILLMDGARTRAPARRIADLLGTLPNVHRVTLPDAGHLGPITHAGAVNDAVAAFLLSR